MDEALYVPVVLLRHIVDEVFCSPQMKFVSLAIRESANTRLQAAIYLRYELLTAITEYPLVD